MVTGTGSGISSIGELPSAECPIVIGSI
jgi:hypothetical protein